MDDNFEIQIEKRGRIWLKFAIPAICILLMSYRE
jgi:hypothetical protein